MAQSGTTVPAHTPERHNLWLWNRFRSPVFFAWLVTALAVIPLLFVLTTSAGLGMEQWLALWSNRLPGLLFNTLSLAVLVAIGSAVLGVSSAWLIVRRRFVGRGVATWLMVLPLTIPTYVFAHIYTVLLEDDGWLGRLWHSMFGDISPPDIYNIWGVTFILSLAGFSYVFLLVRVALVRVTLD